jgi:hypothetical protein
MSVNVFVTVRILAEKCATEPYEKLKKTDETRASSGEDDYEMDAGRGEGIARQGNQER